MAYSALITKADFAAIGQVPSGLQDERINPFIRLTQEVELRRVLGSAFYTDVMANAAQPAYVKLISGETFTNAAGESIDFPGLKMALLCWTWAMFVCEQQKTVTSHGMNMKTGPYSEPIDYKGLAETQKRYQGLALEYWKEAEAYLNEKTSTFSKWKSTQVRKTGSIRINSIGGNSTPSKSHGSCGPITPQCGDGYFNDGYFSNP